MCLPLMIPSTCAEYGKCLSYRVRPKVLTDGQAERRTDRRTDGRTDRKEYYYRAPVVSMQRPNKARKVL